MKNVLRRAPCLALIVAALLSGCAGTRGSAEKDAPMSAAQPRIELLGFPDCPNTPTMRDNLAAALASIGKGWTFKDTNQEKLPEGDARRGWPTPTVLVNGRDLFGMPAPSETAMGCRMYPGGVPDARAIAAELSAATAK